MPQANPPGIWHALRDTILCWNRDITQNESNPNEETNDESPPSPSCMDAFCRNASPSKDICCTHRTHLCKYCKPAKCLHSRWCQTGLHKRARKSHINVHSNTSTNKYNNQSPVRKQ